MVSCACQWALCVCVRMVLTPPGGAAATTSNVGSWAWVSSTLSTATRMANASVKAGVLAAIKLALLGLFQGLQGGTGHAGPELCQLLVAPEQIALVAAPLSYRGLVPAGLGHLCGARGSGRQGGGQVMQDAHERLRVVVGLGGRLLRIGEETIRVLLAVLPEELPGVRQLFGRRRDLGEPMETLVEGGHEGLRLGHQRVCGCRGHRTYRGAG